MDDVQPAASDSGSGVRLVLASGSPRRRRLLVEAGYDLKIVTPDVDEAQFPGEDAATYVGRVSRAKALSAAVEDAFTLGADTVVVDDGLVLGKPRTADEAVAMLRALSGGTHRVLTGWAISRRGEIAASGIGTTEVTFREISDSEIAAYVASGEPMDRAGAYAIQSGAGRFVERIDGSFTNVVGLPMEAIAKAFAALGILPEPPS